MKPLPSIRCLGDLDTAPGFFSSPEALDNQQIIDYIGSHHSTNFSDKSICKRFHFPARETRVVKFKTSKLRSLTVETWYGDRRAERTVHRAADPLYVLFNPYHTSIAPTKNENYL